LSSPLKSIARERCGVRSKKSIRYQHDCCNQASVTLTFPREKYAPCHAASRHLLTCLLIIQQKNKQGALINFLKKKFGRTFLEKKVRDAFFDDWLL